MSRRSFLDAPGKVTVKSLARTVTVALVIASFGCSAILAAEPGAAVSPPAITSVTTPQRIISVLTKRQNTNSIFISLQDTGSGIEPDKPESIFDPFVTTKAKGTGLGLAICKMIIDQHRGKLSASSTRVMAERNSRLRCQPISRLLLGRQLSRQMSGAKPDRLSYILVDALLSRAQMRLAATCCRFRIIKSFLRCAHEAIKAAFDRGISVLAIG